MGETLSAIVASGTETRERPAIYVGLAGDAPRTPGARYSLEKIDRIDIGRGDTRTATRRNLTAVARELGKDRKQIRPWEGAGFRMFRFHPQ